MSERSAGTDVVLGVADSPTGRTALHVAVDIAAQGRLTLNLVRVQVGDDPAADDGILADVRAAARDRAPQLAVTGQRIQGDLQPTLVDRSAEAALLVLGAGSDPNAAQRRLLATARCPVIVVDAAEHIVAYRASADLTAGVDPITHPSDPRRQP